MQDLASKQKSPYKKTSAFGNQSSHHSKSMSTSNQDIDNLLGKSKTKSSHALKTRSKPKKAEKSPLNEQEGGDYGVLAEKTKI